MCPDANNEIRRIEAIMAMDAANPSVVIAERFSVVAIKDHTITPGPALELANKLGVEPFILDNSYGHSVYACPDKNIGQVI
jgi:hypothetical protein